MQRGDSAGKIAAREGVALGDLLKWNKLSERSKLKPGQHLIVRRAGPRPKASSVGRPTAGTLQHGEKLEDGPGYRLRFPDHTFAVESVVKAIRTCAKKMKDQFPGTADVLVGELSRAGGGRFPPHQSHQSGRDADIGYYLVKNQQNATMHRVRPDEVDFNKTWALLRCFVTTHDVSRVYMDKAIQAAMAEWLRQKKAMPEDDLARLFGVLGGDGALVWHAAKHDTHFHVRFSCDKGQSDCVEEEEERPFKL
ncbi:MAG: penicillin-insensitive murein endopeptidase [Myxococcota bacterium]